VRSAKPAVIEFPFSEVREVITPTGEFYVRDHFPQPQLNREGWRLHIEGAVNKTLEFSYDQILAMPSRTIVCTLECAGNGRRFLIPPARGVQWELGGVGTAKWTGVPLVDVLNAAGLQPGACDVVLEGADCGEVDNDAGPHPEGEIHFSRSLPLAKALDRDVLLAYEMNGEELTVAHGFPLRVIVPGWYAVASVKWLSRIFVSEQEFAGYFQTVDYGYWQQSATGPVRVPIRKIKVKAQIARPRLHEQIPIDSDYEIFGATWSGETITQFVEVSTDGGKQWQRAELLGEPIMNAWRLWRYQWHTSTTPGKTVIVARAIDREGNVQPTHHDPNNGDYMINFPFPMEVELV
jgi:DMSO/TMAO reductase YedYZ molybdopterin-dependent catalytic subunit